MSEEERIIDLILRFFLDVDRKLSRQFPQQNKLPSTTTAPVPKCQAN